MLQYTKTSNNTSRSHSHLEVTLAEVLMLRGGVGAGVLVR